MGEMADAIIDGEFDCETGEYIGPGVGYPRTLNKPQNPVFGVQNFLKKRGIVDEIEYHNLVRSFHSLPLEDKKMNYKQLTLLCSTIQLNFSKFISHTAKYLAEKKKR